MAFVTAAPMHACGAVVAAASVPGGVWVGVLPGGVSEGGNSRRVVRSRVVGWGELQVEAGCECACMHGGCGRCRATRRRGVCTRSGERESTAAVHKNGMRSVHKAGRGERGGGGGSVSGTDARGGGSDNAGAGCGCVSVVQWGAPPR